MRELNRNYLLNFESKDAAFEFLVQESQSYAIKEQWKKELQQLRDSPKEHRKSKGVSKFNRVAVFLVALFLFLVSFYWFINLNKPLEKMAGEMLVETNITSVSDAYTRGFEEQDEGNLALELQSEINKALFKKDYNSAIGLFLTKEKQSQLSVDDKFYYALSISQIENADFYKALRLLEDVTAKNEKFINESLWLQGLLFIKVRNPIKAKIILNKLYSSSSYQKRNVKSLLERMSKLN
jgi:hypothetical protein